MFASQYAVHLETDFVLMLLFASVAIAMQASSLWLAASLYAAISLMRWDMAHLWTSSIIPLMLLTYSYPWQQQQQQTIICNIGSASLLVLTHPATLWMTMPGR